MAGKIYRYLAGDHERLDALLERAVSDPEKLDASAYTQFRSGLLSTSERRKRFFCRRRKSCAAAKRFPSRPNYGSITAH